MKRSYAKTSGINSFQQRGKIEQDNRDEISCKDAIIRDREMR